MPGGGPKCHNGICQGGNNFGGGNRHEIFGGGGIYFPAGAGQGIDPDGSSRVCVNKANLPTPECPDCNPIVCVYVPNTADYADPVSCTTSP